MESEKPEPGVGRALRLEVKLYINERLYETGVIPKEVYEEAKIRIAASGS